MAIADVLEVTANNKEMDGGGEGERERGRDRETDRQTYRKVGPEGCRVNREW